jgi:hypothetical protein
MYVKQDSPNSRAWLDLNQAAELGLGLFQVKPSQALRVVSSQAKPSSAGCFKSSQVLLFGE